MSFVLLKDFLYLFYRDKPSRNFAIATMIGLSFSISVILTTLGLMHGFTVLLKDALNTGNGEVVLTSKRGFFARSDIDKEEFHALGVKDFSYIIRTDSFLAANEDGGRAVLVYGVDESFGKINPRLSIPLPGELIIGKKLSDHLGINLNDEVSLIFAGGRSSEKYLPNIQVFKVKQIVDFKLNRFSERSVYANLEEVSEVLQVGKRVNSVNLKLKKDYRSISKIEKVVDDLRSIYYADFKILPFWSEFGTFLRAVEFEKYMIAIVLSVIVIIAIFNCLTFIVYSKEKKAQEIFLLYAIGLSPKKFKFMWLVQNILIWLISLLMALGLVNLYNYLIQNLDIFELPGEVYQLSRLEVMLTQADFLIVSLMSLFFILVFTIITISKVGSKSLSQGLREEFS